MKLKRIVSMGLLALAAGAAVVTVSAGTSSTDSVRITADSVRITSTDGPDNHEW